MAQQLTLLNLTSKRCTKCGVVKELEEFYRSKGKCDGRTSACCECMRAYGQRPEIRQRQKERKQRPDVKAKAREYAQRSEVKQRKKERCQRPDVKVNNRVRAREYARRPEVNAHRQSPEVRQHRRGLALKPERLAQRRESRQRPEVKARRKFLDQCPEARQRRREQRQTPEQVNIRRAYEQRPEVKARATAWSKTSRGRAVHQALTGKRRARKRNAPGVASAVKIQARRDLYGGCCYLCGVQALNVMDHVKPLSKGGANWPCNLRPICKSCNSTKHAKWPYPIPTFSVAFDSIGGGGS